MLPVLRRHAASLLSMNQDKLESNRKKAFTLIEALVALSILSVAMTPVFAQVIGSFRVSRTIQRNMTGTMLAQEGIELVRGIRDDNWFQEVDFDTGLDGCDGADGCRIQIDEPFLLAGADIPLRVDSLGRYQYDDCVGACTDSLFSRKITIIEISDVQLQVISEVTWLLPRDKTGSVTIESYLFDWLNL